MARGKHKRSAAKRRAEQAEMRAVDAATRAQRERDLVAAARQELAAIEALLNQLGVLRVEAQRRTAGRVEAIVEEIISIRRQVAELTEIDAHEREERQRRMDQSHPTLAAMEDLVAKSGGPEEPTILVGVHDSKALRALGPEAIRRIQRSRGQR